jgi:hypothetical protein
MAARPISAGQPGTYVLDPTLSNLNDVDKSSNLCAGFSLDKPDLKGDKPLSLGALYIFETKNSKHIVDSEYAPGRCQFIEENTRIDRSESETQLIRVNGESCKDPQGNLSTRSKVTITATITPNKIDLHYEKIGGEYSCVWFRKP